MKKLRLLARQLMAMIRRLTNEQVNQVASLHKEELSGFLPELGVNFLQLFYKTSLDLQEMFTIVEEDNDTVRGFVTSITETKSLYKKIILRKPLQFGFILLKYFITHPLSLIKFSKILTYPGFSDGGAELLSLVVSRDCRLQGIGRKLLLKTAEEFNKKGIKKFKISVYDRLDANKFYKKIGCEKISSFEFLGEKMNYYEYKI